MPAGGHADPGESPKETVRREAMEELGLAAKFRFERPLFITVVETTGLLTSHCDVDLWYVVNGEAFKIPKFDTREFSEMQWFDFDALPIGNVEPHLGRFVSKLKVTLSP